MQQRRKACDCDRPFVHAWWSYLQLGLGCWGEGEIFLYFTYDCSYKVTTTALLSSPGVLVHSFVGLGADVPCAHISVRGCVGFSAVPDFCDCCTRGRFSQESGPRRLIPPACLRCYGARGCIRLPSLVTVHEGAQLVHKAVRYRQKLHIHGEMPDDGVLWRARRALIA